MDIQFSNKEIQEKVKKLERLVQSNADKKDVSQIYYEIYQGGLAGDPRVEQALKTYQQYLIQSQHDFITDLSKDAKEIGPEKSSEFGYDRTMIIALYEFFDLGGLPDNSIGAIAKDFKMDLNTIATKILKHKQEAIIYEDIVDVICGTMGFTSIAEQAVQTIKGDTVSGDVVGKKTDRGNYNVSGSFDGNGRCQSLCIQLDGSDYPVIIDVNQVPYLEFSKNDVRNQDNSQEER